MLGKTLITKQTGSHGKPCNTVYVVERVYMRKENYISILLDRSSNGPVIIASSKGGMSIEEVDPQFIHKFYVNFQDGITDQIAREVAEALMLPKSLNDEAIKVNYRT